jgi:hypothetical protein
MPSKFPCNRGLYEKTTLADEILCFYMKRGKSIEAVFRSIPLHDLQTMKRSCRMRLLTMPIKYGYYYDRTTRMLNRINRLIEKSKLRPKTRKE